MRQLLGHGRQLGQNRLHPGRVEGVRDPQATHPASPGPPLFDDRLDRRRITRDDDRLRPVHRGQGERGTQSRGDLVLGRLDRRHRPAGRQVLHQPGPRGHQTAGVLEPQDPGRVGGRDLTDRVPRHHVRAHPGGREQGQQADLDGEQPGLGIQGRIGTLVADLPQEHVPHR
ncbi:hypothetical protein Kisp01_35890 [Kineosporia sp. NBRC 101677]|nr:hypothetical protein Kisp01_35890 [Kineosporia sp. NBRC 101677]